MEANLEAVRRDTRGKNAARQLRMRGLIPAVVYGGKDQAAEAIAVDPKVLSRILHSDSGVNTLISITVDGSAPTKALVKDFQLEPVKHGLLHADFYRVAMDQVVTVTVQVVLKGEPRGVKQQGGILDFVHREVEIECRAADIPEHVEVDVSELLVGQSLRVKDVATGARWTPVSDPDLMLVHVVMPRAVVEEAPAEAAPAATAEPEVIKKGKADKAEDAE